MTEEQENAWEDEDDLPALSLSLGQELRVDQSTSILRNVDIELPTEENTRNWERDPISSFVEPIAEESDEQVVFDDKEKRVPGQ